MAYTKYSLTPANNNAAPPDGAPEGMLPSAVNDTMRDMMAQIRDVGDGIRGGTYTMTAPVITGGSITGAALSGNTFTNPVITGGSINNTPIGATTASTGKFSTLTNAALTSGRVTYAGTSGVLQDDADFTFNGTTVTMANDASISGLTVGKGGGAVSGNTAVGSGAGISNTTGAENTYLGYQSGYLNTGAGYNTAVGSASLRAAGTGTDNTAIGSSAMVSNTNGSFNVAVGRQALTFNTTASNNTAVGFQAGYSNTTGASLTAIGYRAAYGNTTGANNTAIGNLSFFTNTTGSDNSAFGLETLYANTTGNENSVFGRSAMDSNTTGASNSALGYLASQKNTTGNYNTAIGSQALRFNTTASNNTAVGYQAGYSTTTGGYVAAFGYQALYSNTTNFSNTALGYKAGYATTGPGNTFVGKEAGSAVTSGSSNTFVGYSDATGYGAGALVTTGAKNSIIGGYSGNQGGLDIRTSSNFIVLSDGDGNPYASYRNDTGQWVFGIGGTSTSQYGGSIVLKGSTANFYQPSVQAEGNGTPYWKLATKGYVDNSSSIFLQCMNTGGGVYLNGASATAWTAASDERVKENLEPITDAANKVSSLRAVIGNYTWDEEKVRRPFLIAQDVQKVLPEAVTSSPSNELGEELGVAYTDVIPLLVAAITELNAKVEAQALEIATLKGQ